MFPFQVFTYWLEKGADRGLEGASQDVSGILVAMNHAINGVLSVKIDMKEQVVK